MGIRSDIYDAFPREVLDVRVWNDAVHGEDAVLVHVVLTDRREVQGSFTKENKSGFGGVVFNTQKDITGLMKAKINSVLNGTSEPTYKKIEVNK